MRAIWMLLFVVVVWSPSFSQQSSAGPASQAVVTFTLDFPNSDPDHYSIVVRADGRSVYECSATVSPDSTDKDNFRSEFEVSPRSLKRIFDLAQKAQYFAAKIDSGNRKLAFTGTKSLTYDDGSRTFSATYNFSSLAAVQELTTLFQNMSNTLEYGRRLAYFHRYQKLALDDELKRMERQARSNELSDVQAVAPVLEEIVADKSVINEVRARAQWLIGFQGKSGRE